MHASRRANAEPGSLGLGTLAGGPTNVQPAAQIGSFEVFCEDCGARRIEQSGPRCHHCEQELGGECG